MSVLLVPRGQMDETVTCYDQGTAVVDLVARYFVVLPVARSKR